MSELEKIINTIKDDEVQKVILFGSRITGGTHPDSDYDLAIIKKTKLPYHDRLKELRMRIRTRLPLDLFVFTPEEFESAQSSNQLVAEIARNGRIIYDRTKNV